MTRNDSTTGTSTDVSGKVLNTSSGTPAIVVLYAENFAELPSAYVFATPEATLGRDDDCDFVLPVHGVSRRHATFAITKHGVTVTDLDSRNGTLVNGARVTTCDLHDGDQLRIGDAILGFVAKEGEKHLPYRIDGSTDPKPRLLPELVGGYTISTVVAYVSKFAKSELSCLVLGETGTGKELVAQGIHQLSGRSGQFQAINCAAIPETLLESELFGYRKGAFSGATRDKPGLFQLANGGTLFLDEIGDMPLAAQAKLLRVLQTREVFPLGGTKAEPVDVRVVSATHRDLRSFVDDGKFRGDLYARLDECTIRLPPLRERKEDIYRLVCAFLSRHESAGISFAAMVALLHYDWPFNVRELESCIRAAVTRSGGARIEPQHLPEAITSAMTKHGESQRNVSIAPSGDADVRERTNDPANDVVPDADTFRAIVVRHGGNISAIARELGKDRVQVRRWLKRYGIDLSTIR